MGWTEQGRLKVSCRVFLLVSAWQVVCTCLLLKLGWHRELLVHLNMRLSLVMIYTSVSEEGHEIQSRELLDGLSSPFLPLYWENSQLLITKQWLQPSPLGIPVFLWQRIPVSHENKTLISFHQDGICHFFFSLAEPSLIVRKGDRLSLSDLPPVFKSITLIHLLFVISSPCSLHFCMTSVGPRCSQHFWTWRLDMEMEGQGEVPYLGNLGHNSDVQKMS